MIVAHANFGRTEDVDKIAASMRKIADHLPIGAVLFCNEIDEGDHTHPRDHELLRRALGHRMNLRLMDTREPIGLDHRYFIVGRDLYTHAAPGVPHQSPARGIAELVVDGLIQRRHRRETALLGGHYPAGAHNGHRPTHVHAELLDGYAEMLAVHRDRIRRHHQAGRPVVWAMDTNWRDFPRLHPLETTIAHHGPDWIRAIPPHGHVVKILQHGTIPMTIEPGLHDCQWARIAFPEAS